MLSESCTSVLVYSHYREAASRGGWKRYVKEEGAPSISEWTLKGQPQAIEKNFSKMLAMVKKLQRQGRMPLKWPSP